MKRRLLDKSLFSLLSFQFTKYWYFYSGALLCLVGTHWTQSHLPFFAKELADLVSEGSDEIDLWKFLFLAVGIVVFRTSSRLLFFHPARILQKDLRVELLTRLELAVPFRYSKHSDGQLFQVLQMDMEQLRALIGFALLQVGNIIVAMSILIPKLVAFEPKLLVALTPLIVAFICFSLIVGSNKDLYKQGQDLQGDVQNIIIESYAGKKTIKNYNAESSFAKWFADTSWFELKTFYKAGVKVAISIPLLPLGIGLSLLWGALIVKGEDLGASSLILFSGFIFLFLEPIMFLSWIGVVFARSYGSWERIKKLVKDIEFESDYEKILKKSNNKDDKSLDFNIDLWDKRCLLSLKRKSWTVFTGKTGHGKTHTIKQIADVLRWQERNISYVAQDPYLYSDTIIANIFLGLEYGAKDRDAAYDLLCLFGLDYLADDKTSLLHMEVGEKGKRLSGGQAKRLALVRSLMSKADVILWDDPFSSVDVILEKQIIDQLKKMNWVMDKTIIMSSHRLTTVNMCSEVFHIEKKIGVVESGSVDTHLKKRGHIYEYFAKQMV